MLLKIEKAILALFTSVFPVFIAACYGMPAEIQGNRLQTAEGTVFDENGVAIPNILVSCLRDEEEIDSTYTLPGDGSFSLSFYVDDRCDVLTFEDIDGAENGGEFASKEVSFELVNEKNIDIVLELEE